MRKIRHRSFKSFDGDAYREDIKKNVGESGFSEAMERKDVNTAFNSWTEALKKAANKHAPWKEFKEKRDQHIPWYTTEIEARRTKNMYL